MGAYISHESMKIMMFDIINLKYLLKMDVYNHNNLNRLK